MNPELPRGLTPREARTSELLQTMLRQLGQAPLTPDQANALSCYLALLMRWNAKMNLTAIRNEEEILRRHFLESILCARMLPASTKTLLDYGSGAGFPGLPCAICRPEIQVTLGESQTKKAAFLREAVRALGLSASVYHGRVEAIDPAVKFEVVTLRAVDHMPDACVEALKHIQTGGWIAILTTQDEVRDLASRLSAVAWKSPQDLRGTGQQVLLLGRKLVA